MCPTRWHENQNNQISKVSNSPIPVYVTTIIITISETRHQLKTLNIILQDQVELRRFWTHFSAADLVSTSDFWSPNERHNEK